MKVIRSTKCGLEYLTQKKKQLLDGIFEEYLKVVNFFIDYFWEDSSIGRYDLKKEIVNLPDTWLGFALKQIGANQAIDLIKSVKNREGKQVKPRYISKRIMLTQCVAELRDVPNDTFF